MNAVLPVAQLLYRRQREVARRTREAAQQVWRQVDPADLTGSWAAQADRMLVIAATGQAIAARNAAPYLAEVLGEQDLGYADLLRPARFVGAASDGRSLDGLLAEPVIRTGMALSGLRYPTGERVPPAEPLDALAAGESALVRIVDTQVRDAERQAIGVGIAATETVTGWVRMLTPPSCGRCAILAGRMYRWSQGFARHDLCQCVMIPAREDVADDLRTDPRAYFDSLSPGDQSRYFGANASRAIRDGADMNQVINAARSTYTAGGHRFTRDGATGRGAAGSRLGARRGHVAARITPEEIYDQAADRGDAIRLLRRHRFIF